MQIRFHFCTDPLDSCETTDAVLSSFSERWAEDQKTDESESDVSPELETTDKQQARIVVALPLTSREDLGACLRQTIRSVRVLAAIADELTIRWTVGHEFEPDLGFIRAGEPLDPLIEELRTTLDVACALSGFFDGDEFVEPDALPPEQETWDDDGQWNQLLDTDDSFIRFPEFE